MSTAPHLLDRLPPHAPEAEQGILGCILLEPDSFDICAEQLKPEAFYDLRHREIFTAMGDIRRQNQPLDTISLVQHLRETGRLENVGGMAFVSSLPDTTPSGSNTDYYIDTINKKFILRQLIQSSTRMVQSAYEEPQDVQGFLDQCERDFLSIRESRERACVVDGSDAGIQMIDVVEKNFNMPDGTFSGLATGFGAFDYMTDGLQFSEQTVIASRPSGGKTALGVNILNKVCLDDHQPTLFVTYEMTPSALMRRLFSLRGEIPLNQLKSGDIKGDFEAKSKKFALTVRRSPLHFINAIRGMNVDALASVVRRMCRKHSIKLVIVDYLQKIQAGRKQEKRTYEVGEVSGTLKGLAVETKAAFLTLAQLSREPEKEKTRPPRLSDLADSAQIERDADTVGLLHRPHTDSDPSGAKATLIIAKQRDGEVGIVPLTFEGQYNRFTTRHEEP